MESESSIPDLVQRDFLLLDPTIVHPPDSDTLFILDWNILCNIFSTGFDKVPLELCNWSYRFPLIQKQLISHPYDIITLQEVDKFEDLNNFLSTQGYQGYLGNKEDGVMGCAVFWKTTTV